ncbi:hypothetical protein ACIBF5_06400 [Micromonospora sp. NPDC050417]|uniref:hypothetical protein n=1 Tax=Micromonospora sp. NPDC050417 TaxID=3364280 RepID=UPI003792AEA3
MNVGEVKALNRNGCEAIDRARQLIEQVASDAAEATTTAGATCHNSEHQEVVQAMCSLKQAIHETELTIRRLNASGESAGSYLAALG